MNQIEFKTVTATNSGAMEADTISKNGRSSKSQMNGILKIKQMFFIMVAFVASVFFYSCDKDDVSKPGRPSNVKATQNGSYIVITWNTVKGATSYNIYRNNTMIYDAFSLLGSSTGTTYTDAYPLSGDNYYQVSAVNSAGESRREISASNPQSYVNFTGGNGGGDNIGGGGNVCANIQNNYNNAKKNRDDVQRLYNQATGTAAIAYANQISNYNAIMETCKRQARENGCTLIL